MHAHTHIHKSVSVLYCRCTYVGMWESDLKMTRFILFLCVLFVFLQSSLHNGGKVI